MRILGIDPGSRLAGFGVIDCKGRELTLVEHGVFKLTGRSTEKSDKDMKQMPERLYALQEMLRALILRTTPSIMAVEKAFFAKNAYSALALGQARGVVLATGAEARLPIYEYSPTEVKQAVTGSGRADKEQVSRMLQILFGNQRFLTTDASDAVSLAVCHALSSRFPLTKRLRGLENQIP